MGSRMDRSLVSASSEVPGVRSIACLSLRSLCLHYPNPSHACAYSHSRTDCALACCHEASELFFFHCAVTLLSTAALLCAAPETPYLSFSPFLPFSPPFFPPSSAFSVFICLPSSTAASSHPSLSPSLPPVSFPPSSHTGQGHDRPGPLASTRISVLKQL